MSLEQISTEFLVFLMLYGGAATAATAPSASLSSSAWDNL